MFLFAMSELTFHPQAELVVRRHEGEVVAVTVAAPVRGRPLRVVTFSRDREPAIVELLRRVAHAQGDVEMDLDEADWERLAEAGLLVAEDQVPVVPRFDCSPRDPPWDLLPRRVRSALPPARERLHVNPTLCYQDGVQPPDEGWAPRQSLQGMPERSSTNPFASGCSWAWVDHPDAAVPSLLSIHGPDRALFRRLRPGDAEPADLDPELRAALVRTGVLVDFADLTRRRDAWNRNKDDAAGKLRRDRYAVVRGLIHPAQIAALRRYYRMFVSDGHARVPEPKVPHRYWAHNEPLARFFHRRLSDFVSELAGEPVKPSYVYFGSCRARAVLEPHRDRGQCALTISLLVDYEPDPEDLCPWPLWLGLDEAAPSGRTVAIDLGLGDGLVYRGTDLMHWRDALPAGHVSTSLFLHYVPADFAGSLD